MTPEQERLYNEYVEAGRKLFESLKPTPQEIKGINDELIDMGWEDLLCEPSDPTNGGDIGLLASNIYAYRETLEAMKEDDNMAT